MGKFDIVEIKYFCRVVTDEQFQFNFTFTYLKHNPMRNLCKFLVVLGFFVAIPTLSLFAQVGINANSSPPNASAMLDVNSTTKGMLIPRMTQAEILAISNPANGLQVFCTTDSKLYLYAATPGQWKEVLYGTGILGQPFPCGITITINHVAGILAPVTKTVTYGTVNNIPGEPAKCWITLNLGATQQATAVSDATEASAGWYFQFNRKQGYRYISSRLPSTTWISSISESSDWITANDPCTLELGTGWRIPTKTELSNVDGVSGGNWTNWNGPYDSDLKLHAAGYLSFGDGSLSGRGSSGYYWSSTQISATNSWHLLFYSSSSYMISGNKAMGFPARCVRD
jgi:hypothetical protein